ncbi:hypothetical protein TrVE_jg14295 [Triparma verrucosa]|uniref:Uncharacterized protein n=1 Tax=Triparma verrucosa TaxID=1606542 RepID=A0A9W7C8K8_9STRA|nr:hypothetical protein TrVE_jg14295 [Triparma verrucosa]
MDPPQSPQSDGSSSPQKMGFTGWMRRKKKNPNNPTGKVEFLARSLDETGKASFDETAGDSPSLKPPSTSAVEAKKRMLQQKHDDFAHMTSPAAAKMMDDDKHRTDVNRNIFVEVDEASLSANFKQNMTMFKERDSPDKHNTASPTIAALPHPVSPRSPDSAFERNRQAIIEREKAAAAQLSPPERQMHYSKSPNSSSNGRYTRKINLKGVTPPAKKSFDQLP